MDESELRMDKVLTLKARIKNGEMINGIGIPMCSQKKDLERILEEVEFDFFNIDYSRGLSCIFRKNSSFFCGY